MEENEDVIRVCVNNQTLNIHSISIGFSIDST